MSVELTDEHLAVREAARDALSRTDSVAAARGALDGSELPDLWPTSVAAGWPGLLVPEEQGGAGLGALEAMLVMWECGRVLASVPLLGHLLGTVVLSSATDDGSLDGLVADAASGTRRVAFLPAEPPTDGRPEWTVDTPEGLRAAAPTCRGSTGAVAVAGRVAFVPDAVDAELFVAVATDAAGTPRIVLVDREQTAVDPVERFDATRELAHVHVDAPDARLLEVPAGTPETAWYLGQTLVAAESLGAAETALQTTLAYAGDRYTFGRPIGSYQAIKHMLVEVLRLLENGRSLMFFASESHRDDPPAHRDDPPAFPLAASALRVAAGAALDHAARTMIAVHGGIAATWEHDAHLFFRRAQLTRRLLGGTAGSTDRVAGEMLARVTSDGPERRRPGDDEL